MGLNITKIESYFEKCILDAFKSENIDFEKAKKRVYYYFVIIGNEIVYSVHTPYNRVNTKIEYRLRNNLERNFGLAISVRYKLDRVDCYPGGVSPAFFRNIVMFGNIPLWLIDYHNEKMFTGREIPNGIYEELCKAYHNIDTLNRNTGSHLSEETWHLPSDLSWEEYRKLYYRCFKEYPEVYVRGHSRNLRVLHNPKR